MASYSSAANGSWQAAGSWSPAGIPGDGDDVTIVHTITIDSAVTIGVAGATASVAIALNTGGSLTVSGILTLKGDLVVQDNTTLNFNYDVIFKAPTGSRYRIYYNGAFSGTATWAVNGTSVARISLSSDNADGGSNGYVEIESAADLSCNFDYFDWAEVGDASQDALTSNMGTGAGDWLWDHGKIQSCGRLLYTINNATDNLLLNHLDWREPANNTFLRLMGNTVVTTGTRQLNNCTTYKSGTTLTVERWLRDLSYSDNVFVSTVLSNLDRNNIVATSNLYLLERFATLEGTSGFNDAVITECGFISDCPNPHYIGETTNGTTGSNQFTYNIFDGFDNVAGDFGDIVIAKKDAIISYNIIIEGAGTLVTLLSSVGNVKTVEHNTCFGSRPINVGESQGAATQIEDVQSNLFVSQVKGVNQDSAFVSQNAAFVLNNNGFFDMTDATNIDHPVLAQNSYLGSEAVSSWWASGSYGDADKGATDIYGDPGFVDSSRTAATWDTVNGGVGTLANILSEALKLNGFDSAGNAATYDSNYSVENFKSYIRAGFAPTNVVYEDAGHDSVTVGALEIVAVTATVIVDQTEAGDSQVATLQAINELTADQSETGDTQAATFQVAASITASQTETGDTQTAAIQAVDQIVASQIEIGDIQTAIIQSVVTITASQTGVGDTQAASLVTVLTATVTANQSETGDSQAAVLQLIDVLAANQSEIGDSQTAALFVGQPSPSLVERSGSNSVILRTGTNSVRIL